MKTNSTLSNGKIRPLFTLAVLFLMFLIQPTFGYSQTSETFNRIEDITSLKPADGNPVYFSSQEELNNYRAMKTLAIKEQILENQDDKNKVEYLRKELWRFENAMVSAPKDK